MDRHKLTGNGMWESSRMILPEHRERIRKQNTESKKKKKPIIDDDEFEQFGRLLQQSAGTGTEVRITIYDEYVDREIIGTVLRVDPYARRIRIAGEWVSLSDIVKVDALS